MKFCDWISLSAFVLAVGLLGCTKAPPVGIVHGEVTLDGQAVADGGVQFVPIQGNSQTGGATIKDGKFTVELPVAQMKVEIHATKPGREVKMYDTPDSPTYREPIEIIPQRYNANSELKLDVKAGKQDVRYDLKSK